MSMLGLNALGRHYAACPQALRDPKEIVRELIVKEG